MNASTAYRDYLVNALRQKCHMNSGQVNAICGKFDSIVEQTGNSERAFRQTMGAYASEDTDQAVSFVQTKLEELNSAHEGIDTNPATRLRKYIDRFNSKISALAIEVKDNNGNTIELSQKVREQIKLKDPAFLPERERGFTHVAKGSFQGKQVEFGIEIKL